MDTIKRKTYFIDIDGTILEYIKDFSQMHNFPDLQQTFEANVIISKWHCEGHQIILVTSRPESMRKLTIKQLDRNGIIYDMLIMGIGSGERILINDASENDIKKGLETAKAWTLKRNVGLNFIDEYITPT